MKFFHIPFLILIFVTVCSFFIYRSGFKIKKEQFSKQDNFIYCIMVTGKTKCRNFFAKKSVDNFIEQTYPYKKLIILNHGDETVLEPSQQDHADLFEFKIDKSNMTLGDIRNVGLELVAPESYWTTWDDDDYRDKEYLEILYKHTNNGKRDLVAFTDRYEYNYNTDFFWQTTWLRGYPTCLVKLDKRFKFLSKDSMEDVHLFDHYKTYNKDIYVYENNDPKLYLRLVHTENTSLWIDKNKDEHRLKKGASLYENTVDYETSKYYTTFLSLYYKEGLTCMRNS
jgi:hypothetical protein